MKPNVWGLMPALALSACGAPAPESTCDEPGVICTLAGTGRAALGDDGISPEKSALYLPQDALLYIADTGNACIRRVTADGTISAVAGRCGELGDTGDGAPAMEALLNRPYGTALGPDGRLYIADTHNHRIRTVAPAQIKDRK